MENYSKEKEIYEDNLISNENMFKIEYKGQNLKNNQKFLNWKNMIFEKYKESAKLFYCDKDKIFFYTYWDSYQSFFFRVCPICGKNICYFCGQYEYKCCFKRKIYRNIVTFFVTENIFREVLFIYFIPYLNSIYIIASLLTYFLERESDYFLIIYLLAIILSIPFFFTIIIFLIILGVISIPFNFFPFKVFAGFLVENLPIRVLFICCICCWDNFEDDYY